MYSIYSIGIMNVLEICVTLVERKLITRCLFVLWSLVLLICKHSLLDTDVLFTKYLSYLRVVLRRPPPRNGCWKCVFWKLEVVCVYFSWEPPAKGISGQCHSTGSGENNMLTRIELCWISQGKAQEGFVSLNLCINPLSAKPLSITAGTAVCIGIQMLCSWGF